MSSSKRAVTGLCLAAALGTMGALPAHAEPDPEPPATERISTTYEGAQLAEPSYGPAMGAGRVTGFTAEGPAGRVDTDGLPDVYLHDGYGPGGSEVSNGADGPSYDAGPCASGRMFGFVSESTTLGTPPRPDHRPLAYIRNRAVGKITGLRGYQDVPFASMTQPRVDPTCQWIAYTATLVPTATDPDPRPRVYRFRFNGGTTDLVSEASGGAAGHPSISADGRYVAYEQDGDVHVRDLDTGTVEKASVARDGGAADGASSAPSLSADGRRVAFESRASDLAPGDGNRAANVFVRDLDTGTTTLIEGPHRGDATTQASLAKDGTHVAYVAAPARGKGPAPAVYLRELATGKPQLISVDLKGGRNDRAAGHPSVNEDGTVVAYDSASPDLVPGDTNGVSDVFLRTVR
ncbi:TolB family protein [Streptomyces sp. NPDC087300]|uniref:TolB family protein n=1 Tax=Streptomyces sp. NPDC087300 TaxID=3365780 RepID=UPI00380A3640